MSSFSLIYKLLVDFIEKHNYIAFFTSESSMALVTSTYPHVIYIYLDALDWLRKALSLGDNEPTILTDSKCDVFSLGRLQRFLTCRTAVSLSIVLNFDMLIATSEAAVDEDGGFGKLDPISLRPLVVKLILHEVNVVSYLLWNFSVIVAAYLLLHRGGEASC